MATIEIPKVRFESGIRLNVGLSDSGVAVDWSGLENIAAFLYSESQHMITGPAHAEVDGDDPENLIVTYGARQPQYLGVVKVIIRCRYHGREKTYDKAAFTFVATTAEATGILDIDDPVVDVHLDVSEVSTSLLDDAIDAALAAAAQALAAAEIAEGTVSRLSGGNVNQFLKKRSNADMDFVWSDPSSMGHYEELPDKPKVNNVTLSGNKTLSELGITGAIAGAVGAEAQRAQEAEGGLSQEIEGIEGKIPTQASSDNQLADKSFVNSSIGTNTANYISDDGEPFTSVDDLPTTGVTNNDYAFVTGTDDAGNVYYDRYKATVSGSNVSWAKEYRLNNSSFTANQWAAIQSGITSGLVAKLGALPTAEELSAALLAKYSKPSSGIPESDLSQTVREKLNLKEVIYGYYFEGAFYEESTHETLITPALEREYVDLEGNVPYIWKNGEYVAIGGGGGGGDVICDIDDALASVLLRWPLLGLSIKSLVRDYPSLADGLLAHPDLAPQYIASKDVLDENEGLDESVAAYPTLVSALASTPEIGAVIVANEGLDAVVAAYPSVASLLVANPSLVPSVIQYPAVAKAMAKWPALAPVLVSEPRYIPYLAEDEIIAHSLVETGRRAWLVGDGTAYINTGLYQLEWPLKVKTNVAYNTNTEMYLGGNYSSGSNGSRVGIASSKHTMYSGSNYQPISTAVVLKQEYAVEFEFSGLTGKKMTVDGAVNESASAANKVGANNLPFGFFSGKGNAVSNNLNGRISDADLTIGESTYHYIPAMYDGKYGYLETTTMEFKGNNNTSGQFYATTTIKNNG